MLSWFITSPAPLALAAALYMVQAYGYTSKGDFGMALALVSYAVANVGFIISYSYMGGN
jgi:hypothetical protein